MQRRNYAALLAALVIGFGAIQANAAEVLSVTIDAPADSGTVLGIGGEFTVTAVVEDYTAEGNDGVIIALVTGNDVVADSTTGGGKDGGVRVGPADPDTAAINTGLAGLGLGQQGSLGIVAVRIQRQYGNTDSSRFIGGDATSVGVDPNAAQVTYIWRSKVHVSSTEATEIRAVAVAVDNGGVTAADANNPNGKISSDGVGQVQFDIDAERPVRPAGLINVETKGDLVTAVLDAGGTAATVDVAGIGDVLQFDIAVGPGNMRLLTRLNHTVVLALKDHNGKELKSYPVSLEGARADTLAFRQAIAEGDFGDLVGSANATAPQIGGNDARNSATAYIVDPIGNRSKAAAGDDWMSPNDQVGGANAAIPHLLDAKKPVIDGVSGKDFVATGGDTLEIASPDTITDGTLNDPPFSDDLNPINYKLHEKLSALDIDIGGQVLKITNREMVTSTGDTVITDADDALNLNDRVRVIFSVGDDHKVTSLETQNLSGTSGPRDQSANLRPAALPDGELKTGVHTIKVTGTDYAGNVGPAAERADVYVDVDDLAFNGLFPTEADISTIEETSTSDVRFALSEHADSVLISYTYVSGKDRPGDKTRALVGGELLDLEEQVIPASEFINAAREDTGLVDDSKYQLTLLGADLAGNFSLTDAGAMTYDTNYVVPQITYFSVSSSPLGGTCAPGKCAEAPEGGAIVALADPNVTLTINAWNKENVAALAYGKVDDYNNDATVTVAGGSGEGLALSGKGVLTGGLPVGTARLTKDAWGVGVAEVKVTAQKAPETYTVTVHDSSDADSPHVGMLDSVLVIKHAAYNKMEITVSDTIDLGAQFQVALRYVDEFGNTVLDQDNYVEVSTPILGVELPQNALPITKGTGSFFVRSNALGELALTVRDIGGGKAVSKSVTVVGETPDDGDGDGDGGEPPMAGPAAPAELVGEDYKGALGEGDQGGFVMLSFPSSADHSTLDRYRIWRQIQVTRELDADGNLVELSEPKMDDVSWGTIDAIPGESLMRVVVATLDGDATHYGVSSERHGFASDPTGTAGDDVDMGGEDTMTDTSMTDTSMTDTTGQGKRAFTVMRSVSVPYELMAETMVRSREAAVRGDLDGPVFATLTPEALAFHERGLLPSFKSSTENELREHITRTEEAVRAIDDLAPAPVTWVRALDTPADAGASITIEWTRSIDDRLMTSMVPQALGDGGNVYISAGVEGYNISRRTGDGPWQPIDVAPAGSSSYEDVTAQNGVRYSYKVEPTDLDNTTTSEIEQSAMAIRNTVVDSDGNRIVGLFGADSRVDFDDFFIFADHFGLTSESDIYEAAFDIIPNDVIDVDDFFAFAESFGKEVAGIGKVVPTMAGLNSEARFYIDNAAAEPPRVGEELTLLVSLEDFVEVRGYGFTVNYDHRYLEFVEPRFESSPLGEAALAQPQVVSNGDGELHIAALGETVSEGDLGVTLVFRPLEEIEESLVEIMAGGIQDGSYGLNRITDPVSVRIETRPEVYALENNYPNPFNPETTLKYELPDANDVTLEVFNMLGQVVRTLVDREFQNAGRYTYQWDATNDGGQPLSSGIYFYRVTAGGEFQSHKKMLLLK